MTVFRWSRERERCEKNKPFCSGVQRLRQQHPYRKSDAQSAGRNMACEREVEHVIKKQDGAIGERNTCPRSRDPRSSKG